MKRRRRSFRTKWDPVANWDGMVTAPNKSLITPEQMHENAKQNMLYMEQSFWIKMQNLSSAVTPIGGMQYRYGRII